MSQTYIILRLMAEAQNADQAESEVIRMTPQIEAYAEIKKYLVEQYWKIPSYQEITLYLLPRGDTNETYNSLIAFAGDGWTHDGDQSDGWSRGSVWNPKPGLVLLSPRVKWAELSLWRPDVENEQVH